MRRRQALGALMPLLLGGCSPARLASSLAPGDGYVLRRDIAYGTAPRQQLDLYLPDGAAADAPVLVFFYGGAWRNGARADYGFVGQALSTLGTPVAIPDYRLYPEVAWPSFVEDGAAAIGWVRQAMPGRRVFVLGHSAGAFIAAAVATDPQWLGRPARDSLAGCVTLAGAFDFVPERGLRAIFAAAPGGRAMAVPLDAPLASAPPLLLLHGAADGVAQPDQSRALAARMVAAGASARLVEYPGVGHVGVLTPLSSVARGLGLGREPVLAEVGGFVRGSAG